MPRHRFVIVHKHRVAHRRIAECKIIRRFQAGAADALAVHNVGQTLDLRPPVGHVIGQHEILIGKDLALPDEFLRIVIVVCTAAGSGQRCFSGRLPHCIVNERVAKAGISAVGTALIAHPDLRRHLVDRLSKRKTEIVQSFPDESDVPLPPYRIAEADLLHQLLSGEMAAIARVEPTHTVVAEAAIGYGIVVVRTHIVIDPHAPWLYFFRIHPDFGKCVLAEVFAVPAEAILCHRTVRSHHVLNRRSVVHQSGTVARRHILPMSHAV